MSDKLTVIESDDYRKEISALMADPIIVAMTNEIPNNLDMSAWGFTQVASEEYNKRGGKNARSIGGPARAIQRLKAGESPPELFQAVSDFPSGCCGDPSDCK